MSRKVAKRRLKFREVTCERFCTEFDDLKISRIVIERKWSEIEDQIEQYEEEVGRKTAS